jgi:hypothetical protein
VDNEVDTEVNSDVDIKAYTGIVTEEDTKMID